VGEKQNQPFHLSFNQSLKVDFQGSRVTSDSGLLLVRELDERLGLSALITENIMDDSGIHCMKSKHSVRLFRYGGKTFSDVLRQKLKWGER